MKIRCASCSKKAGLDVLHDESDFPKDRRRKDGGLAGSCFEHKRDIDRAYRAKIKREKEHISMVLKKGRTSFKIPLLNADGIMRQRFMTMDWRGKCPKED